MLLLYLGRETDDLTSNITFSRDNVILIKNIKAIIIIIFYTLSSKDPEG